MSTHRNRVLLLLPSFVAFGALARAQTIERVSVSSSGAQANHNCFRPRISADGNVVVFASQATNLVAGDTNGLTDLFVRDRAAQTTKRVNVGNAGQQSTLSYTEDPAHVSADGRIILFDASGLDPADGDPESDVYVHDRLSGLTTFVSTSTQYAVHHAEGVTQDGRKLIYSSSSSNASAPTILTTLDLLTGVSTSVAFPQPPLTATSVFYQGASVSGDGRYYDFGRVVHFPLSYDSGVERLDLATGALTRILSDTYFEAPLQTSLDGRYVLYSTYDGILGTRLDRLDTLSGATVRIDVTLVPPSWGSSGLGVYSAAMSSDGAYVAFTSDDSNIVQPDPDPFRNAFVRVPAQFGTLRADDFPQGLGTNGATEDIAISASGALVAFTSWGDQFVAGDTNQRPDVFVRAVCGPHYPDLDQDGHGALGSASTTQCLPPPAGWSVSAGDCDDTRANVRPFSFDGCDGLDNDCDGALDEDSSGSSFCVPSSNASQTCVTAISANGCLSLAPGGSFVVTATNLEPQRAGLLFYGVGDETTVPWGAGGASYLCVTPPRQRTTSASTGGAGPCSGALSLDLAAWLVANPTALGAPFSGGEVLRIQGWYRDPLAPLNTSLTSALRAAVSL